MAALCKGRLRLTTPVIRHGLRSFPAGLFPSAAVTQRGPAGRSADGPTPRWGRTGLGGRRGTFGAGVSCGGVPGRTTGRGGPEISDGSLVTEAGSATAGGGAGTGLSRQLYDECCATALAGRIGLEPPAVSTRYPSFRVASGRARQAERTDAHRLPRNSRQDEPASSPGRAETSSGPWRLRHARSVPHPSGDGEAPTPGCRAMSTAEKRAASSLAVLRMQPPKRTTHPRRRT